MATPAIMQFFTYAHLRDERMQTVSKHFADLAQRMLELLPDNPQREAALASLLDAKDRTVRAVIYRAPAPACTTVGCAGTPWRDGEPCSSCRRGPG